MSTPTTPGGPAVVDGRGQHLADVGAEHAVDCAVGREDDADPAAPAPVHAQHRPDRHRPTVAAAPARPGTHARRPVFAPS